MTISPRLDTNNETLSSYLDLVRPLDRRSAGADSHGVGDPDEPRARVAHCSLVSINQLSQLALEPPWSQAMLSSDFQPQTAKDGQ